MSCNIDFDDIDELYARLAKLVDDLKETVDYAQTSYHDAEAARTDYVRTHSPSEDFENVNKLLTDEQSKKKQYDRITSQWFDAMQVFGIIKRIKANLEF